MSEPLYCVCDATGVLSASSSKAEAMRICNETKRKRKLAVFLTDHAQDIVAKIVADAPHLIEGMLNASHYQYDSDCITSEEADSVCVRRVDPKTVGDVVIAAEEVIVAKELVEKQAREDAAAKALHEAELARLAELNALAAAQAEEDAAAIAAANAEDAAAPAP